jgi:hypothetical protein
MVNSKRSGGKKSGSRISRMNRRKGKKMGSNMFSRKKRGKGGRGSKG